MKRWIFACVAVLFAGNAALAQSPAVGYSLTFGGSGVSQATAIAHDANDNVYVAGNTTAPDFPTLDGYQTNFVGTQDVFVQDIVTNGTLVFSTLLGGSGLQSAQGIALDFNGNIYVTGYTTSTNFPVLNAVQMTNGGGYDAFVTELNPTGNALIYSTYLGGSGFDAASGIAVDGFGDAIVTGYTTSANFPTANPFQAVYGGNGDAFIAELSTNGSSLVYASYLGGKDSENNGPSYELSSGSSYLAANFGGAVAVDIYGDAYVTGWTYSTNFPVLAAFQSTNATSFAGYDSAAFVTEVNPAGSLVYSTYFGGEYGDYGRAIGVDFAGNVYFAGNSAVGDLPVTTNAYQPNYGGNYTGIGDGFLASLDATGTNLLYCTYLGGSGDDQINGIAVRDDGAVTVTGFTDSPDFPILNAIQTNGHTGFFASTNSGSVWNVSDAGLGSPVISALAVDPFNPSDLYALTSGTGLCKSVDNGAHWTTVLSSVGSAAISGSSQGLIAFDPVHAGTLYAGGYNGVFKTTDGGADWIGASGGLPSSPYVQALAVDPNTPSTLYVGTYSSGVYKSVNAGTNWSATGAGLNNTFVTALLVDPLNSPNVYAGLDNAFSPALFKSTNGGASWSVLSGYPTIGPVVAIAANPANPSAIYMIVGNFSENATLCLTTNGGAGWSQPLQAQGHKLTSLAIAPGLRPTLAIAQSGTNGALSWLSSYASYVLQTTPTLSPAQWQKVTSSVGSNGGNFTLNVPTTSSQAYYRLVSSNGVVPPPVIYLGSDLASQRGVIMSTNGGVSWASAGLANETINAVAVSPSVPNTVYAGVPGGNNAFVANFAPGGQLYFSTYFGGTGLAQGNAIAMDVTSAFVAGSSSAPDFPTTPAITEGGARPLATNSPPVEPPPKNEFLQVFSLYLELLGPCQPDQSYTFTTTAGVKTGLDFFYVNGTPPALPNTLKGLSWLPIYNAGNSWRLTGLPTQVGKTTIILNLTDTDPLGNTCNWKLTLTIIITADP